MMYDGRFGRKLERHSEKKMSYGWEGGILSRASLRLLLLCGSLVHVLRVNVVCMWRRFRLVCYGTNAWSAFVDGVMNGVRGSFT